MPEDEAEFDLVELTELHTRLSVATRMIGDLYPALLRKASPGRFVERPGRYQEIGHRIAALNLETVCLQDKLGAILNEKIDELNGVQDDEECPEETP